MDKLLELLKLKDWCEHIIWKKQSDWWYMFWLDDIAYREERILGKKFWFIKWLVDNDKIDISKIKCWYVYNDTEEDKVKNVIMNLSISDTPIEDLCVYLKDDATEKINKLLNGAKKTCENIWI